MGSGYGGAAAGDGRMGIAEFRLLATENGIISAMFHEASQRSGNLSDLEKALFEASNDDALWVFLVTAAAYAHRDFNRSRIDRDVIAVLVELGPSSRGNGVVDGAQFQALADQISNMSSDLWSEASSTLLKIFRKVNRLPATKFTSLHHCQKKFKDPKDHELYRKCVKGLPS